MPRDALSKDVAERLAKAIIGGQFEAGSRLPNETELATRYDVSRPTMREAVKLLSAARMVEVQRGRGTTINPTSSWTDLPLVVRAEMARGLEGAAGVSRRLVEARRVIERGSAEMAAVNRDADDLRALSRLQEDLERATEAEDLDRFVDTDLAFHTRIMQATGNVFLAVVFDPLAQVLADARRQTSAVQEVREHAAARHRRILEAIDAGDSVLAGTRMDEHMTQTLDDLDFYIFGGGRDRSGSSGRRGAGTPA